MCSADSPLLLLRGRPHLPGQGDAPPGAAPAGASRAAGQAAGHSVGSEPGSDSSPRSARPPPFPDTGVAPQRAGACRTHRELCSTEPLTCGAAEDPGAAALAAWTFIHGCRGPWGPLGAPHNLAGVGTPPNPSIPPGPCRAPDRGLLRTRDCCSLFRRRVGGGVGAWGPRGRGGALRRGGAVCGDPRPWEFAS